MSDNDTNFWSMLMGTDEGAANYMESYGEGPGYVTRKTIGSFINDGETVLDVGCGPGWNMDHFIEYGPAIKRYKGVDYSERFVRVANNRRRDRHYRLYSPISILPFELQDCRDLKEQPNLWDVVILQDCLEHTNGYEKPVLEALRVARRRVIVSFWHLTEDDDHINDDGNDGYGAWYSRPKWEKFLNSLPYVWFDYDIHPEGKTHQWDFYIIDKALRA